MGFFACALFVVVIVFLHLRLRSLTANIKALNKAIEKDSVYLLENTTNLLKADCFETLQHQVNKLLHRNRKLKQRSTDTISQINATLGQMQEAVLIVDNQNRVLSSNVAANQLLDIEASSEQPRIESLLRSSQLLDYLQRVKIGERIHQEEFVIEDQANPLWFELSAMQISNDHGPAFTLVILHDITRLKKLESIRKDFVANVSHELRTPVTIIKGFTDTLLKDHTRLDEEARGRFLEKIHKNVERFNRLLEDLLSLSRLESEKPSLNRRSTSMTALAHEVAETFSERITSDKQSIVIDLCPNHDIVYADPIKIAQVFANIIENALHYAKGFTHITVRSHRVRQQLWITVEDDGCGIPVQDIGHIFERFYRVDKGRSRESGGTGLGLSIAKHTILLHGGEIYAESDVGEGTQVHFSLPLLQAQ